MKAVVAAIVILAAVAAAVSTSAGTMTVDLYAKDGCSGSPMHTFSPKVDTCEKRGHHGASAMKHGHPESFKLSVPTEGDIAKIVHSTGTNCSTPEMAEYIPCGSCMPLRESGEFFMFNCNTVGKFALVSMGCNSGCTSCKHSNEKFSIGMCDIDHRNSTRQIKFESMYKGFSFQESGWEHSTDCSGVPTHERTVPTDVCEGRMMFSWAPSRQ